MGKRLTKAGHTLTIKLKASAATNKTAFCWTFGFRNSATHLAFCRQPESQAHRAFDELKSQQPPWS
jgi:hypothetical protein